MRESDRDRRAGLPLVCIGEALVDLICPDPTADPAKATPYEAHFGGALANVAVAARRAGAPSALAGGCGADRWGRFLRDRLEAEGVDLEHHSVIEDLETPFARVTIDVEGEPAFRIEGAGIEAGIAALAGSEMRLVAGAGAIAVGSNTLPDEGARAVTMRVRDAARAQDVPLLFDPNLRPGRWAGRLEEARRLCLDLAGSATLLKLNIREARWLLGTDGGDAAACAAELVDLGPGLVVVTSGSEPVVARGACDVEVAPPEVEMVSPLGAGDVFMGTLAAGLWQRGWTMGDGASSIEAAAAAGAEACSHLGAFD